MKKWFFRLLKWFLVALLLVIAVVFYCDWRIDAVARPFVFSNVADVPANKVALVLGTSQYLADGRTNLYFEYRIKAAAQLYKAGKVQYVIVSGDNKAHNYNEPRAMKRALVKLGIPEEKIYLDYAGFRTLDSVVRAREIFGQDKYVIVSQPFHNKRAVFIARRRGMEPVAYNAKDVELHSGFKTQVREKFARVKVFLDLYVLQKQPYFLGEKVPVGE